MLNIWTKNSGYSLGTFPESLAVSQQLPVVPGAAFNGVPPASYDGTNHHPTAPLRNSAGAPFARGTVNSYVDGIYQMRSDLPNARTVSNLVVRDAINHGNQPDPNGYSGFMYAFGQFLTHDLEFARPGTVNIDVIVPAGDIDGFGAGSHIPVNRNAVAPNTGTDTQHPALPMNDVTGWIDCSVVYGVTYPPGVPQGPTPFQNPVNLREGGQIATTGKLLTSSNGRYAPIVNGSFLFGDPRGTENPDLSSIQTLFIREHNWHVDRLKVLQPTWTGEQLYQRARSIVIAEFQNITYKEWLPKVIGNDHIPAYTGFNPFVDSTIKIEFAAAAMRFGHSIVSGAQDRVDEQGNILESLTLAQAFFLTPAQFERNGGADGFIRKLASDISNKLDVYIIDDLRNLLNDPPAALDLAATNIQRGRDLGLPSLNQMRVALGFPAYTSFSQITSDSTVVLALQNAYGDIDKVDLWVGGLAEFPATAAMVGPTFQAIIIDQFTRLRDGDSQWFENQPWSASDLEWLRATTLSDIILRNTDTIRMQSDAFVAVERADLYNGTVTTITARTGGVNIPGTDSIGISYKVISGQLPTGLRIVNSNIVGTPFEVPRTTEFNFCIRATLNNQISDRTFKITVEGADIPVFNTDAGALPVGTNSLYFVLDSSFVNFQISVTDTDTTAGQVLKYFISSGDGDLPPGLTLTEDGKIVGLIKPLFSVSETIVGNGNYGNDLFDVAGYDFGIRADNGYESFGYDSVFYDYFIPAKAPKKLNRNYEFIVSVSDGDTISKRKFKIYVVGEDYLRADNTIAFASNGVFTVDGSYLHNPVWLTSENLGLHRANNYLTIVLDCYDAVELGPIVYTLDTVNPDNTSSILPPGLTLDLVTSELFGIMPYQPTVTETYKFTVTATRYGLNNEIAYTKRTFTIRTLGEVDSVLTWDSGEYLGAIDANFISNLRVSATSIIEGATVVYSLLSGSLPPGLDLQLDGEITGKVNQYGSLNTPGIVTFSDGPYTNQTFDGGTTSVDKKYTFTIKAQDQFGYSSITRKFILDVNTPNDRLYSNIVARTFMTREKRSKLNAFLNNSDTFPASSIYRPNDLNFGIQRDLIMTVYSGIETKTAGQYVSAMGLNHKKKRFVFGETKIAKAKIPGTNDVVYEVIYVEMIDPLEKGKTSLNPSIRGLAKDPKTITVDSSNSLWAGRENMAALEKNEPFAPRPDNRITIDQNNLLVSDSNPTKRFPSSISLWRKQLATVGATERNYLPLWMRSIQDESKQEIGFVLAVPICYCKPGTSADVLLNIKYSEFDFKDLDYTVDRYIIDSVTGSGDDKYLVFKDDRVTII